MCLAILAGLLVAAPASAGPLASDRACPQSSNPGAGLNLKERAVRCQINHLRQARGKRSLKRSKTLDRGASGKLRQIRNCASGASVDLHDPCGVGAGQVYESAGYFLGSGSVRWGENIFYGGSGTARGAVKGWLHSSAHRRNMLKRGWRHIGIASSNGVMGSTPFFVAAFGAGGKRGG